MRRKFDRIARIQRKKETRKMLKPKYDQLLNYKNGSLENTNNTVCEVTCSQLLGGTGARGACSRLVQIVHKLPKKRS